MNTRKLRIVCGIGLLSLGALGACGGGQAATPDGDFTGCVGDPRADSYSAGMMKVGKSGTVSAELASSDPGPPIKGVNSWSVLLKDSAGAPVDGATIGVKPYMPDHGHGTQVKAVVTPMTNGVYGITPLYFYMAGLWQTTLDVTFADRTTTDSVVFSFCIGG
jgi:YtkA-like